MFVLIKKEMNDQGQERVFIICTSDSHRVCKMEYDKLNDKTGLEIIEE